MEVLGPRQGAVDSEELMEKVDLFLMMFSNSLRLPFCRPVQDILDFIQLALTQLHPNAWRILMSRCIIWHRVLGVGDEEYLDLTARGFFYTH